VIREPFLGGQDAVLPLVGQEHDRRQFGSLGIVDFVKTPKKVVVSRELKPRDDIAPLGKERLRNRRAEDLALVEGA
jgi:hypothetical protein